MASTVLSGTSSFNYTNSTGQNVRVVINYMRGVTGTVYGTIISMSWANGGNATGQVLAIGRNLAFTAGDIRSLDAGDVGIIANNACPAVSESVLGRTVTIPEAALPTEIMLATGQTFSATCSAYNIVVIPEAG